VAEPCSDPVALSLWHPIGALEDMQPGHNCQTQLLGEPISYARVDDGDVKIWRGIEQPPTDASSTDLLPSQFAYGYIWTCLGDATGPLFDLPEFAESDRRNVCAASVGVHVSAPRAVENFLDMGHFPYVHTGVLGEEPHTEVREYDVAIDLERDEVLATRCQFYQPQAAAASSGGAMSEYIYRVPHPYCAVLYKSCPTDESRLDVIALFLQPMDEEHIKAHALVSVIDADSTDLSIRMFQQTIFAQDKPILENQFPRKLPLDPRAETPIRADKSAIAYRRWLRDKGLQFGVIPAAA